MAGTGRLRPHDAVSIASSSSSSSSTSSSSSDMSSGALLTDKRIEDYTSSGLKKGPVEENETEFLYDQNFHQIRDELLKGQRLFEDPEFPPNDDLLRSRSKRVIEEIEWLRPHEFIRPDHPILVSDRNEGFDIRSGLDSWFAPAFSAVAESEALLKQVIPLDQGFTEQDKYAGIFHFRFWFGRWIEIVVDDRIPVRKSAPLYMKSASPSEMWPSLLEKAYAKAKGSYELLNFWLPIDGCIELTGGIPERVKNLPSILTADPEGKTADRLFYDILRASQLGNIVLVSPPVKKTRENKLRIAEATQLGLNMNYIYRVTQVANLGGRRQIIRVKNCYGQKTVMWCGAWNPEDVRWTNLPVGVQKQLDAETFHDGGFWMAYGDFLKYFQALDICHLSHQVDQEVTFHGRWERSLNAGGVQKGNFKNFAKNPQCFIRLSHPDPNDVDNRCSAIVSLMQRRHPNSRVKGINKIGFKVYKVDETTEELNASFFSYRRNDGSHKKVAKTPTWVDGRETNLRIRLPKGKYCIIPCTFQPEQEGDFILRVHIERFNRAILNNHTTLDLDKDPDSSLKAGSNHNIAHP